MATWTTIPDSSLEPGKPIRSIDALALRDNPVAIAEGAVGAPRNQLSSLENPNAGSVIRSRYDATITGQPVTYQVVVAWGIIQTGTFRVAFEHRRSGPNSNTTSSVQVVRNRNGANTVLQTWTTTSTTFQVITIDVPVVPGDTIIVQNLNTVFFGDIQIRNIRLQTNGERWWPAPTYQRVE
jgi:hypothetical protein